jgi:N-acyl-L-homoserine lactone synthetase
MSLVAYSRTAPSFTDRVFDLLDRVDYRQAITDAEKDAVYRLRYQAYLREGAIPENFSQRLSDRFDDLDNTWIMGVFVDGRLAGSIRLSISSPAYRDMPATKVFPDFLESDLDAEKTIIDPTRFVIDQNMARSYPELPYVTTRIGWMAGEYFDADAILATVRTEHQAFYKRTFGHELVADARDYPTLTKPLSLMRLNYAAMKERVHRRYPFFRSTQFERRALFGAASGSAAIWASGGEAAADAAAAASAVRPALAG